MANAAKKSIWRQGAALVLLTGVVTLPRAAPCQTEEAIKKSSVSHAPGGLITAASHKIWYETEGHGPPILLIPGGPGFSHDLFHPFFSSLSDQYRIIYYDPFGTGKSERATNPADYSLEQEIEEVEELRKALGIERWDVFGHSWGGVVAQGYAIKYAASVCHLVVSDSPVSGKSLQESNDRTIEFTRELFPENWRKTEELRAKGLKSTAPEMAQIAPNLFPYLFLYRRDKNSSREVAFNPEITVAIMGKDMDFALSGDGANFDWRSGLASLKVPTLVLNGRADFVVTPRQAEELAGANPGAKLVIFEKSGHFPFSEETTAVMQAMRQFLARGSRTANGNPQGESCVDRRQATSRRGRDDVNCFSRLFQSIDPKAFNEAVGAGNGNQQCELGNRTLLERVDVTPGQ